MPGFIRERLDRAKAQLESAKRNLAEGDLETASNRAFLAAENSASAAIAQAGGRVSPLHKRIRSQFEDLCDRGIVPHRFRNTLIESYRFRLRGNYGRRFHAGRRTPELKHEAVQGMIRQVSDLISSVERISRKKESPQRSLFC